MILEILGNKCNRINSRLFQSLTFASQYPNILTLLSAIWAYFDETSDDLIVMNIQFNSILREEI